MCYTAIAFFGLAATRHYLRLTTMLPTKVDIEFLDSLVTKSIVPSPENANTASATDRVELSSIFLEFLNLFGDVQSIKRAEDRHAKLLPHRSVSEMRKRHAEDFLTSDKAKMARSYSVPSPAQSSMGAYPNAQSQWAYGVQPQTWPPATQSQGQQWAAGYTQQGAYGAYAGYGCTYANPQLPASVPQSTAYAAAYPPAYPVQLLNRVMCNQLWLQQCNQLQLLRRIMGVAITELITD